MANTIYKCSKLVRFTNPDNPKITRELAPGFIGNVPEWVENDWYFKALCTDGSITAIKSTSDRDIQAATDTPAPENKPAEATPNDQKPEASAENQSDDTGSKKGNGGKK